MKAKITPNLANTLLKTDQSNHVSALVHVSHVTYFLKYQLKF